MASEKVTALVEQVKELTVLELSELVHTLEEVFGVSAAGYPRFSGRPGNSGRKMWCTGSPRPALRSAFSPALPRRRSESSSLPAAPE